MIFIPYGIGLIRGFVYYFFLFQSLQAVGENIGRDIFTGFQKIIIPGTTPENIPDNQKGPFIAIKKTTRSFRPDRCPIYPGQS